MGPNTIKRVEIQLSLLTAITDHWEIKQKINQSDEEFSALLAMFKKNLERHKQWLEKREETA